MAYSGRYKVKNKEKYQGDASTVVYRSLWERNCMKHFDESNEIKSWSSEEVVIPYIYDVDKRYHRYFMDFKVTWADGKTSLIEVKPNKETTPPKKINTRNKKYLNEALTYVKNMNKWEAANEYAKDRGWKFEIWTEIELRTKGLLPKPLKPLKKMKPYSRKKTK
tara:strand:- start:3739 stop:4230 length:492 start_codon:yes stop_codon:yes gene_type:complete